MSDTGTGMAPGVAQQATNVFVTTKPHGKGTGLGLRMAHPFASTHSGKISIETAPGQGTAVRFSLPYTGEAEPGRPAVAGLSITACYANRVMQRNLGVWSNAQSCRSMEGHLTSLTSQQ